MKIYPNKIKITTSIFKLLGMSNILKRGFVYKALLKEKFHLKQHLVILKKKIKYEKCFFLWHWVNPHHTQGWPGKFLLAMRNTDSWQLYTYFKGSCCFSPFGQPTTRVIGRRIFYHSRDTRSEWKNLSEWRTFNKYTP